jgi:hypothetical protein
MASNCDREAIFILHIFGDIQHPSWTVLTRPRKTPRTALQRYARIPSERKATVNVVSSEFRAKDPADCPVFWGARGDPAGRAPVAARRRSAIVSANPPPERLRGVLP